MMLTEQQFHSLLAIVDKHHNAFIANFVGTSSLPPETLEKLRQAGVVAPKVMGVRDAYLHGMVAANLPPAKGKGSRQTYRQMAERLQRNPIPLSEVEKQAVSAAQAKAGQYISGLGAKVKADATERIMEADAATRAADRRAYRKTIAQAIEGRKQIKSVVSDLGHATGDWTRNLERVATTELAAAMNQGTAQVIGKKHGNEARVAIQSSPICCDSCNTLTREPGTKRPKIFSLAEIEANGTNVGRKAKDWRAVCPPIHPNCLLPGELVTTGRGETPVERVRVGDWVITHLGRWRQVTRTWASYFQGSMVAVWSEGTKTPITCTPNHRLAVGHEVWWPADTIRPGGYLVSLLALTPPPPARTVDGTVVSAERWVGTSGEPEVVVRTPWGVFSGLADAEPGAEPGQVLASLEGSWRMSRAALTRMAEAAPLAQAMGSSQGKPTVVPRCFPGQLARHRRDTHQEAAAPSSPISGGPTMLARQSIACHKLGDRLKFSRPAPRPPERTLPVRERPRRVVAVGKKRYAGQVYNLSVDEDESYLVRGQISSNCGCVLVRVPDGMGFGDDGMMRPNPS